MNIITRFAPSPTGFLHAGNYRTALFAYIFARQNKGKFVLRIEDTDKERSKKEYEDNIVDSLKWLGLDYDAFYRQSDRTAIYGELIKKLIDSDKAYVSKETPIEAGDRSEVIRFRNPNKKVVFDDLIRGPITFDTTQFGDFIIARSLTEPIFHFVVVVDDGEIGTTHIIRGEDHISNTSRHILIYEALGLPVPKFVHIPLLLAPDRSKLSKRNGSLPITEYRNRGYLPEAVVNYLALLGWHPVDEKEILSMDDLIKQFSFERVQKASAIFDENKMRWFNREYLLKLNDDEFIERAKALIPAWLLNDSNNREVLSRVLPLVRDKTHTFGDIPKFFEVSGELSFIEKTPIYPKEMLLWKKNPSAESALKHLLESKKLISTIPENSFSAENIKNAVWPYTEANSRGDVLWPLRTSLTGLEKSPDPFISAFILGKEESLKRIEIACNLLK